MTTEPTSGSSLPPNRKRPWRLLGLAVIVGVAFIGGYGLAQFLPLEGIFHKSTAVIEIQLLRQQPGFGGEGGAQRESDQEFLTFGRTQAALLKSRFVLVTALKDPKIADLKTIRAQADPIKWLEENLHTDFEESPEILRVTLKGWNPDDIRTILNAVIDAYLQEVVREDEKMKLSRISALRDISRRYEQELAAKRRTIRDLTEATGSKSVVALDVAQGILRDRLKATTQQLLEVQRSLRAMNQEVQVEDMKQKVERPIISEFALDEELNKDRKVLEYEQLISQEELKRDVETAELPPGLKDPQVKKRQDKIDTLKMALANYREKRREELRRYLLQKAQASARDVLQKDRARILVQSKLESELSDELRSISEQMKRATQNTVDLDAAKDDLEKVSTVAKRLRDAVEAANLDVNAPPRVRVRDKTDVR
jgi:hypothetical protein